MKDYTPAYGYSRNHFRPRADGQEMGARGERAPCSSAWPTAPADDLCTLCEGELSVGALNRASPVQSHCRSSAVLRAEAG